MQRWHIGYAAASANPQATNVLGAIADLGERTGDTLSPFHQRLIAERCAAVQQILSQAAWTQGHAWTPAQAADAAERWLTESVLRAA